MYNEGFSLQNYCLVVCSSIVDSSNSIRSYFEHLPVIVFSLEHTAVIWSNYEHLDSVPSCALLKFLSKNFV